MMTRIASPSYLASFRLRPLVTADKVGGRMSHPSDAYSLDMEMMDFAPLYPSCAGYAC
jgi:hypothetical protein